MPGSSKNHYSKPILKLMIKQLHSLYALIMKQFLLLLLFCFIKSTLLAQVNTNLSLTELDSLANLYSKKGQYEKAEPYALQSLEKSKSVDSSYAHSLAQIANIYFNLGRNDESESYFQQALKLYAKTFGKKHKYHASTLSNLALVYQYSGRPEKAVPLFHESMQFFEDPHPNHLILLNNLATSYYSLGRLDQAEAIFVDVLKLIEKSKGKDDLNYATCMHNLATVYWDLERFEEAHLLYIEALGVYKKHLGTEHPSYASTLNNLSILYEYLDNYEKAGEIIEEVLEIQAKTIGKSHQNYAVTLSSLAGIFEHKKEFEQAEKYYLESLKVFEKALTKDNPDYLFAQITVAGLYKKMKKYQEAEPLFLDAEKKLSKLLDHKHPNYINSLIKLGEFYRTTLQLDTAIQYCLASIKVNCVQQDQLDIYDFSSFDKFDYYSYRMISESLISLMGIVKEQYNQTKDKNKLKEHLKVVQAALRLNERIKNEFSGDGNKLRLLKDNNKIIQTGLETILLLDHNAYFKDAFAYAELNKSILLADVIKANKAWSMGDLPDSLVERELNFRAEMDLLKKKQAVAKTKEEKDLLSSDFNELNLKIEAFKKEVKAHFPKYHQLKFANI